VHNERIERPAWAFHHDLFAFNQVEYVDRSLRIVRDGSGEPMPAGFDELELVQAGSLFAPTLARGNGFYAIDEGIAHPFGGPIPLDIRRTVVKMDGPRPAI
jgi:hypothetical protein